MTATTLNRRTFAGCAILAAGLISPAAYAASPDEQLVHEAANRILEIGRNGGKREDYAAALAAHTAVPSMAMFVLGKHRRKLKPKHKQRYLDLFNEMVLNAVTKHGKKIRGKAFVVTGTRGGIIQGYVQHNLDSRTGVEFRTKNNRITDIRIQGIWLAITLRKSVNQLVQQDNGKLDAVFTWLKSDKTP